MTRAAIAIACVTLAASSAACLKIPRTCAPNDALCQQQMGAMNNPQCKNGTGSNGQCLDPRAP